MKFKCKCGSTMVALSYKTEIDRWKMIEEGNEFPQNVVDFNWAVDETIHRYLAQCEECSTSWVSCRSLAELIDVMKTMGVLE